MRYRWIASLGPFPAVFNDLVDYMLGAEHTKRPLVGRIDQNRAQLMQAGVSNVTPQPIGVWNNKSGCTMKADGKTPSADGRRNSALALALCMEINAWRTAWNSG